MASPVTSIYPAPSSAYWADAKTAYTEWAHMLGLSAGFEQLSNLEVAAWCKVAQALRDVIEDEPPLCTECELALTCQACHDPECLECGTDMICPNCNDLTCAKCGALVAAMAAIRALASMPGGPMGDM